MDYDFKELIESKEYKDFHETFERIQRQLEAVMEPIRETVEQFNAIMKPMIDAVNDIVDCINKSVLSDDDKKRIKALTTKLAEKDIVVTPEESPFYFYKFNPTKKNIKALYDSYSSGRRFDDLTKTILTIESIDQQYCKEAIACYKNKCYLACSSLLLSAIDSFFIAKNKLDSNGHKRTLNKSLANDCLTETESERNFEYFFIIQSNVLLMLAKLYDYGNDFENEPNHINRNFVNHGMVKRKVAKHDCVKLFIICSHLIII